MHGAQLLQRHSATTPKKGGDTGGVLYVLMIPIMDREGYVVTYRSTCFRDYCCQTMAGSSKRTTCIGTMGTGTPPWTMLCNIGPILELLNRRSAMEDSCCDRIA